MGVRVIRGLRHISIELWSRSKWSKGSKGSRGIRSIIHYKYRTMVKEKVE